jgi:hypothetical protein
VIKDAKRLLQHNRGQSGHRDLMTSCLLLNHMIHRVPADFGVVPPFRTKANIEVAQIVPAPPDAARRPASAGGRCRPSGAAAFEIKASGGANHLGGRRVDPVFEEEAQHFARGVRSSPVGE